MIEFLKAIKNHFEIYKGAFVDSFKHVNDMYWGGNYFFVALFVICFVLLIIGRKKNNKAYKFLGVYTILYLILIIYNPILFKFLTKDALSSDAYSMRLWIVFPSWIIISYVLGEKLGEYKNKIMRFLVAAVTAVLIVVMGTSVLENGSMHRSHNIYKINDDSLAIAKKLMELSDDQDTSLLVYTVDDGTMGKFKDHGDLVDGIKQYTGKIEVTECAFQPEMWEKNIVGDESPVEGLTQMEFLQKNYVKNYKYYIKYFAAENNEIFENRLQESGMTPIASAGDYTIFTLRDNVEETAKSVSDYLNSVKAKNVLCADKVLQNELDINGNVSYPGFAGGLTISSLSMTSKPDYVVAPVETFDDKTAADSGFKKLKTIGEENIWKREKLLSDIYEIRQYPVVDNNQGMLYTITDSKGHLVIIDGGWDSDTEQVRNIITAHNNHVDAWILTHPHFDHIRAFNNIMGAENAPVVDHIYASEFDYDKYMSEAREWDQKQDFVNFKTLESEGKLPTLKYVHAGDTLDLIGLKMEVFHDYQAKVGGDAANDGSLVFKLSGTNRSMLFCGDTGVSQSDVILNKYRDKLKSTYIQMGHHGNGGLNEEFYRTVSPEIAFFDAPDWLFDADASSGYTSAENRKIMESMGCACVSYHGGRHVVYMFVLE